MNEPIEGIVFVKGLFFFLPRFSRLDADRHDVKQIKKTSDMKFLLHDPHLLSSSPFVRFLRVRGRKNGKQRRTMKLHARTTRFWLPPIYVGSRKRGNRRRKCNVRDQSRRFGSENRRGARPRTQLPRPSRRKVALRVFLLNDIHRRGVYQPSCI